MRRIRAILFDLDNTLWDVHPVIVRAEQAMHAFLAERYPRVTDAHDLESFRALRVQVAREHPAMSHDFTWLRKEALRRHAEQARYPDTLVQEAFDVFFRARNEVVLYDDVRPALDRLVRSHRLFAISNGNANLAVIGLDRYFEAHLAARDAGMLKPDPRIFSMLLDRAGIGPEEAVHVGDEPEADVEGARAAGVLPVWLNRDGVAWPRESAPPRLVIGGLDELPGLLEVNAALRGRVT